MVGSSPKVLLVSPPWQTPNLSNLGLSTLRGILLRAGIETDELHGMHLFPAGPGSDVLRLQYAAFFFVPYLHPEVSPEACIDAVLAVYLDACNLQGLREPSATATFAALGVDEAALRGSMRADIERAGVCIERCVEAAEGYDVVGFSCTFEPQLPAALAIAGRLKARRPDVRLVLGGAACFGEPAAEILKWSHAVDAVCHCEGDDVIVPLIRALRAGDALEAVPGIVWRDGGVVRKTPAPPLLTDMDTLPVPDYTPFVWQLKASSWGRLQPLLQFETSRGCWWGEKHLCTFCGLNAEGLTYRKKSAERAYQEIRTLYERYPTAGRLHASDNILDQSYLKTLMPRLIPLARRARPLRMFWEIRASLKREDVRILAEAGVSGVQPGIESFSDQVLSVMDKGATGLNQVQHLKWLSEDGMEIVYNVLVGNPGEEAAAYREMCELVPYLEHLPPPILTAMWLERFSPYFETPERYGLTHIRARSYYRALCRAPEVDLERLAYVFDYDHAMFEDRPLRDAQREFARLVLGWSERWRADTLFYRDAGANLEVLDRRDGGSSSALLSGAALALFRYLDRVRTWEALQRHFPDWPAPLLLGLLDTWRRKRWLCRDEKGRYLVVVPRKTTAMPAGAARELATEAGPAA